LPYLGEIYALAAPLCWSVAIILFLKTGEHVPPLALNLFKNILALILFALTLMVTGTAFLQDQPLSLYLLLIVSGVIGIGISDTLFFMTLNRVGAGLQAIINTSYSPSIIFLSFLFLGERLSSVQLLGVAAILSAVLSIVWVRRGTKEDIPRSQLYAGIALGVSATFTQAISIVMIKPVLGEMPLIWANFWRLLGGLGTMVLMMGGMRSQWASLRTLRAGRVWRTMIPASVIGTYVSLLFWLGGMKYTQASTAAALNQTSTLWTFLLAVILLHEPLTPRRIFGLCCGIAGVVLVTFG